MEFLDALWALRYPLGFFAVVSGGAVWAALNIEGSEWED